MGQAHPPRRSTLSLKIWRQLSRWRLNLAGVAVICGAIAMMAVMLGRAHPPPPPPQTRIAQDLGSRGAQEWIDLEHRYRTRYSRNAEEWAIRDFFQDKRGGIFVDVGSNDPRTENNTYFLEATLGWSGVAIDAMQEFAPEYARYRPRTHFLGYSCPMSRTCRRISTFPSPGPWERPISEHWGYSADRTKVRHGCAAAPGRPPLPEVHWRASVVVRHRCRLLGLSRLAAVARGLRLSSVRAFWRMGYGRWSL